MAQEQPTPPNLERPWYYQNWFLIASFIMGWPLGPPFGVLWPVWAFLILRSPWHSHTLIKGLGWAMLAVGGVMFYRQMSSDVGRGIATLVPGIVVTVIIQVLWTRFRQEHDLSAEIPQVSNSAGDSPEKRPRLRRRVQRRRRTRSSRY